LFAVKVAFAELIFERVVDGCMAAGLVKGDGFAANASAMEANASPYHGKAPHRRHTPVN